MVYPWSRKPKDENEASSEDNEEKSDTPDSDESISNNELEAVYYLGNGPSLYESVGNLTEFYPPNDLEEENEKSLLPMFFVGMYVIPISFKRFRL